MGPRVFVRDGEDEGFIVDDLAGTDLACPYTWRTKLRGADGVTEMDTWSAAWTAGRPEFAPVVAAGRAFAKTFHVGR